VFYSSFLLLCCKHVVDIFHCIVLYFILCDMYVLSIGVIKNNNNKIHTIVYVREALDDLGTSLVVLKC